MSFHKINECGVERGQVLIKVTISFNYSYVVNECGVKTRVSFVYTQSSCTFRNARDLLSVLQQSALD